MQANTVLSIVKPWLLAAAMLLPMAELLAAPGDALGPAIPVFEEATPHQTSPAVARDGRGNTVVVWADRRSGAIVGRRFAADGAPLDAGFQISTPPASPRRDGVPEVASDAAGNFVVVWSRMAASDYLGKPIGSSQVLARRFSADGVPVGEAFSVDAPDSVFDQGPPAVAMTPDGDFVVAWQRAEDGFRYASRDLGEVPRVLEVNLARRQVVAQRFAADGRRLGATLVAGTRPDVHLLFTPVFTGLSGPVVDGGVLAGYQDPVDVAINRDGDFAIVWGGDSVVLAYAQVLYPVGAGTFPSSTSLFMQRYDRSGVAQGPIRIVASELRVSGLSGFLEFSAPAVAMADDGSLTVVWRRSSNSLLFAQPIRIVARRFDRHGLAQGLLAELSRDVYADSPVSVAASAGGTAVVSWIASRPMRVLAARLDAGGRSAGPVLTVAMAADQNIDESRVASDPAGNFVVVWSEDGATDTNRVMLRGFSGS